MCICGPLFVTCRCSGVATTDNVSATQLEDLWSETKPSVQTYKQKKLNPLSLLQYSVGNFHLNRWLLDADRYIVW